MLHCNLAVLLAERSLKITKVSKDTGISRTTLTSLTSNKSQGIQFETLNKLCIYLNVTPQQIIEYIPYDFSVEIGKFSKYTMDEDFEIKLTITENKKTHVCHYVGKPNIKFMENDNKVITDIDVDVILPDIIENAPKSDILFGWKLIKSLPSNFQMELGELVTDAIIDTLNMRLDDVIFTSVGWFVDSSNFYE